MNRTYWLACSLFVVTISSAAHAGVIARDWKTPGDGLLTYDDVNQREWLDLSQTILAAQFPFPGVDRDAKYQYVVGQTVSGGLFEGFQVAKSADVIALAQSAGIDTTTQSFATNSAATLALSSLLDYTMAPSIEDHITLGLLDEVEVRDPDRPLRLAAIFWTLASNQSGLRIGSGQFQFSSPPGVMLFRGVPEPSALVLSLAGLLGLRMKKVSGTFFAPPHR